MSNFSQGEIITIDDYRTRFLVISKNAFIEKTAFFHVCPLIEGLPGGPLHIAVRGNKGTEATVLCEQIKLIDPQERACEAVDRLPAEQLMDVADAIQGIFETD